MSLGQHFPGETIVQVVPNIEHLVKIVSQDMPMDLVTFFFTFKDHLVTIPCFPLPFSELHNFTNIICSTSDFLFNTIYYVRSSLMIHT